MPRPLFTPGKGPVRIVQEAVWDPGPVWTGAENLAPTGFRSPDRTARSQSRYRLSHLGPLTFNNMTQNHYYFCIKSARFVINYSSFSVEGEVLFWLLIF
jgi:hypothetical protein